MKGASIILLMALGAFTVSCSGVVETKSSSSSQYALRSSPANSDIFPSEGSGAGTPQVIAIGPVCGNGSVETGEQCDGGICCTRDCKFKAAPLICDFETSTTCSGFSATCGKKTLPVGVEYYSEVQNVAAGVQKVCP